MRIVASFCTTDDPFENLGMQVVKQASQVTAEDAGDGTTTSTMMPGASLTAQPHLVAGTSPTEIKRAWILPPSKCWAHFLRLQLA